MATDFGEKERTFVDGLMAETGRDLEGWMLAIESSGRSHRNDIIDWLRQQGFGFGQASWLERIHHNGGRLIYAATRPKSQPAAKRLPVAPPSAKPSAQPPRKVPRPATSDADLDALLASAKAYRPLAQVVLRDILAIIPGADATTVSGHIVISHERAFAAILPSARDVKLLLALGADVSPEGWDKARLPSSGVAKLSGLTHMMVLTDARQWTKALTDLVLLSNRTCRD